MPLNGTAFAGWAERFATYAEGEVPFELVSTEPGAQRVPFVHDGEKGDAEATEAGWLGAGMLNIRVRQRLVIGALYTFRGYTWQVAPTGEDSPIEEDAMAGATWHFTARLVRHVV